MKRKCHSWEEAMNLREVKVGKINNIHKSQLFSDACFVWPRVTMVTFFLPLCYKGTP